MPLYSLWQVALRCRRSGGVCLKRMSLSPGLATARSLRYENLSIMSVVDCSACYHAAYLSIRKHLHEESNALYVPSYIVLSRRSLSGGRAGSHQVIWSCDFLSGVMICLCRLSTLYYCVYNLTRLSVNSD